MWTRAARRQRSHKARGTEQVGLRGEVGGIVELDRGRRMDDDVAGPNLVLRRLAEPQALAAQVDLDDSELLRSERGEALLAELLLESLERRARKHFALKTFRRGTPRARADGQVDARDVRNRPQALLDDR